MTNLELAQSLLQMAKWYSMPDTHRHVIDEVIDVLSRPRCSLDKCPFTSELMTEKYTEVEE